MVSESDFQGDWCASMADHPESRPQVVGSNNKEKTKYNYTLSVRENDVYLSG